MALPVRVVIPTIKSREKFLETLCLPTVINNDPADIVVVRGDGSAPQKRNRGARGTTWKYLLFVDDDSRLLPGCIAAMVDMMELTDASFCYSDFQMQPQGGRFTAGRFNPERLQTGNYIDTTSLIRAEAFPGFDENILRYQDWDLWLTITKSGGRGVYLEKLLFEKWKIDVGITESVTDSDARGALVAKHGIPS
jgi:GT2 family glycosyltransferase